LSLREIIHIEQEAFEALQKNKEKGLDYFFNRYYTPLVLFSTSLTHNHAVSEEIASEAFLKMWNNRKVISESGKIKFLLFKIVHNASIDYLRANKSRKQNILGLSYLQEISDRSILDKLVEIETHQHLCKMISILPPRCRQIFQLFYYQDMPIKEIAHELGISINTVKTQKQRAIQLLREHKGLLSILLYLLVFKSVLV
jgi:RNA polymerase sigma-70 factor (family 1)